MVTEGLWPTITKNREGTPSVDKYPHTIVVMEVTWGMAKIVDRIVIENFKCYRNFDLSLANPLTLIVGDNEAGKSTLLEAIHLCLTQQLYGRPIAYELSPYLLNKECVREYTQALRAGQRATPPKILIEVYLCDLPQFADLKGTNNSKRLDVPGIRMQLEFDESYVSEYESYVSDPAQVGSVPTEYYRAYWYSFAGNVITRRSIGVSTTFIDTTTIRLQSGSDHYIRTIIEESLDAKERAGLALAYRQLKEEFAKASTLTRINTRLQAEKGAVTDKTLQVSIDVSRQAGWEANLTSYLDDIPFQFVGKGDQSILKMLLALDRSIQESHVILIEEPENHLSYATMASLVNKIQDRCKDKQVLIATHSTFVLNKLGLDKVVILGKTQKAVSLSHLSAGTQEYFRKLPGYDTLRLAVAKKVILVEGASDELFVQRAFRQVHGVLPIARGIDVISVRGLSFKRFLEIGNLAEATMVVITDNDGDYERNVEERLAGYIDKPGTRICYDKRNDLRTLELQIIDANPLGLLNEALGTTCGTKEELQKYMLDNKVDCALKLFDFQGEIGVPQYIMDAVHD